MAPKKKRADGEERRRAPMRPGLRARIQLTFGSRTLFGDGKAHLLGEVDRLGSLRAAAESMDMSYRHAWGLLRELEEAAGLKLLEHTTEGRRSPLRLTDDGRRLLGAWRRFREPLDDMIERHFERVFGEE